MKPIQHLTLLLIFFCSISKAQTINKYTISGYLIDKQNGEKLIGATLYDAKSKKGAVSNVYGFYSLTLPKDTLQLTISYVGFSPIKIAVLLNADLTKNFELEGATELKTVEILANESERIEDKTLMSVIDIPIAQIKKIPALLGEVDVLKVLQLLPGVKSGGEGASGLYVRGGGPDQNLILLDGAPIYNASHLFGFFSVFNADAIKTIELSKGGFPARYGGRLSSVIDINMKEGNAKKYAVEGNIGIISSKILIEGPIWKDRTSFMITGRRTYIDLLARPIIKASANGSIAGYYFYDINAKVNHKFTAWDHMYLSYYQGKDVFYFKNASSEIYANTQYINENNFNLNWGNRLGVLRWNHVFSSKLFCNTSLSYTQYNFNTEVANKNEQIDSLNKKTSNSFALGYITGVRDLSARVNIDYLPNPNHAVKFGSAFIYHNYNTGALQQKITQTSQKGIDTTIGTKPFYANEFNAYAEDDWTITENFRANIGLHFASFYTNGTEYNSLQPRLSLRYLLPKSYSLKASYTRMTQFIHLLSNSNIGLPTDLWVPATNKVKPQNAHQIALGSAKSFDNNKYEVSIEAYYKKMNNIIDYLDGANFLSVDKNWETKVASGKGESYGMEFFVQRKKGKITGWIGYTLSYTNRQFDEINFGKPYPYKYDRRHDLSFVISYKINERMDISGTWVYGTGNALTLPLQNYQGINANALGNNPLLGYSLGTIDYYNQKNGFRMPSYHRADIGFNIYKKKKWGTATWNFGAYNLYNRQNPYFIYLEDNIQNNGKVAKQVSLFPIIPSISYGFKF